MTAVLTERPAAPLIGAAELRMIQDLADQLARTDCVGFTSKVQLVRGVQSSADVAGIRSRIASAWEVGVRHVEIIEDPDNASLVTVTIAFPTAEGGHPLEQPVLFTRPTIDVETGLFRHGRAIDQSWVQMEAHSRTDGTKFFWFSGSSGGGKSAGIDHTLLELCSTGCYVPFILDMKGGASLADWRDRVPVYIDGDSFDLATKRQAMRLLHGFLRMTAWRAAELGRMKNPDGSACKAFPFSPDIPIPLLVLEEVPDLWVLGGADAVSIVESLARKIRALMAGLILASQDTSVGQKGKSGAMGGSAVLRKQLRDNGTAVIYKNARDAGTQTAESALGKLDPSQIPDIKGACYVQGPASRAVILNRGIYVPNVHAAIQQWVRIPDMAAPDAHPLTAGSWQAYLQGCAEYDEKHDTEQTAARTAGRPQGEGTRDAMVAYLRDPSRAAGARRADVIAAVKEQFPAISDHAVDRVFTNNPALFARAEHGLWKLATSTETDSGTDAHDGEESAA